MLQTDVGFEKEMKLQKIQTSTINLSFASLCFPIVTILTESRNTDCPTLKNCVFSGES